MLIAGDISYSNWDINKNIDYTDSDYFDARAFRGKNDGSSIVFYLTDETSANEIDVTDNTFVVSGEPIPYDHDCVLPTDEYNLYDAAYSGEKYYGAIGKYISLKLDLDYGVTDNILKGGETYRFGIRFTNSKGIKSSAVWITDLFIPYTHLLQDTYYKVELTITSAGKAILANQDVVNYELLRVERTNADKSIICQGIAVPMIVQTRDNDSSIIPSLTENTTSTVSPYNNSSAYYTEAFQAREDLTKDFIKLPSLFPRMTAYYVNGWNSNIEKYCVYHPIHHLTYLGLQTDGEITASFVKINNVNNRDSVYYSRNTSYAYLDNMIFDGSNRARGETPMDNSGVNMSFMYTKMWQIYSPDIKFNLTDTSYANKVRLTGLYSLPRNPALSASGSTPTGASRAVPVCLPNANDNLTAKASQYVIDTNLVKYTSTSLLSFKVDATAEFHKGTGLVPYGFITDSGNIDRLDKYHYYISCYKSYLPNYKGLIPDLITSIVPPSDYADYDIYGIPEVSNGESNISYNNDSTLRYSTTLREVTSDNLECTSIHADCERSAVIVPKFTTNVLGTDNNHPINHVRLEEAIWRAEMKYYTTAQDDSIWVNSATNQFSGIGWMPVVELIRTNFNQYGGNTYEARSRNKYLTIGNIKNITDAGSLVVDKAGDVFKHDYKSQIIGNPNPDNLNNSLGSTPMVSTSIDFPLESSCNLNARYDLSKDTIDTHFMADPENYNIYNKAYNRESNVLITTPTDFRISNKDLQNNILLRASKTKIPGELIDSFSDFLVNEELLLDGKYGSITKLVNYKDVLFAFQESGISAISVNPRVQVIGNDGIQAELGTGTKLDNKTYINTYSGLSSYDKNSVVTTPLTFYYFDRLNKSIYYFNGNDTVDLALEKGFSKTIKDLYASNHNVYGSYNHDTKEMIMYLKSDVGIKFSTLLNELVCKIVPNVPHDGYFNINKTLYNISPDEDGISIYKSFKGASKLWSNITLLVNPDQGQRDCRFDNISWLSGEDDSAFTTLQVTNEYQDTGIVTFATADNLYKPKLKFRRWSVPIPRDAVKVRDRIRSPYCYITLSSYNTTPLSVGDIIISYNN